jgi:hypothetical protein
MAMSSLLTLHMRGLLLFSGSFRVIIRLSVKIFSAKALHLIVSSAYPRFFIHHANSTSLCLVSFSPDFSVAPAAWFSMRARNSYGFYGKM